MLRVWIIAKKFEKCKDFIGSTNYRDAKVTIGRTKRGDWSHQLEAVADKFQAAQRRSVKKTCQWQVFSVGHACFTGMVRWFLLICKGEFSAPLKRGRTLAGGSPFVMLYVFYRSTA